MRGMYGILSLIYDGLDIYNGEMGSEGLITQVISRLKMLFIITRGENIAAR
jgi:hypothetical protein